VLQSSNVPSLVKIRSETSETSPVSASTHTPGIVNHLCAFAWHAIPLAASPTRVDEIVTS